MHASEEEQKQAGRATRMSKKKRQRTVTLKNLLKGLEQLKASNGDLAPPLTWSCLLMMGSHPFLSCSVQVSTNRFSVKEVPEALEPWLESGLADETDAGGGL
jgi:hypothetical protein